MAVVGNWCCPSLRPPRGGVDEENSGGGADDDVGGDQLHQLPAETALQQRALPHRCPPWSSSPNHLKSQKTNLYLVDEK